MDLRQIYYCNGNVGPAFSPIDVSAVGAWLRNATNSGNVSSVPDVINVANPAVQTVDARRPAGNADFSLQFFTNDALVWPLIGNETAPGVVNNGTRQWGCAFWADHDGAGVEETYVAITNLTGVATAMKIEVKRITTTFLRVDVYIDGVNARRFTATTNGIAANTPTFVTVEYNADQTGETNQLVITVNGAVLGALTITNIGAGGDIGLGMTAGVTGNMCIGNRRDSTAASPLNGALSRNIFFFSSAMAGVTQGLLTPAARLALMGFEPL